MIYRDKRNLKIETVKQKLGLSGDVYVVDGVIEDLQSHLKISENFIATNIEEAEQEMIYYLKNNKKIQ